MIIAPLLVVWFGFGIVPKLAIIALVCFFPVVVTTLDALGNVDPDQLKLLRTLDASRWQAFRYAEAPAALPAALSGAKIAVAVAVIGAVFAEYAGLELGPRPPHAPGDPAARDRRAPTPPWCCSPRSPSPSSPPSPWPSAGWCRGPTAERKDPARDADPPPDRRPARRRCALALAACGEKQESTAAAAEARAGPR